jgi:hypothetical protein
MLGLLVLKLVNVLIVKIILMMDILMDKSHVEVKYRVKMVKVKKIKNILIRVLKLNLC